MGFARVLLVSRRTCRLDGGRASDELTTRNRSLGDRRVPAPGHQQTSRGIWLVSALFSIANTLSAPAFMSARPSRRAFASGRTCARSKSNRKSEPTRRRSSHLLTITSTGFGAGATSTTLGAGAGGGVSTTGAGAGGGGGATTTTGGGAGGATTAAATATGHVGGLALGNAVPPMSKTSRSPRPRRSAA